MLFDIEEELKKLPSQPGVYIMHDAKDEIIYVGKAISLKNRVRQYFQSSRGKTAKIQQMVSRIARFEYIVTIRSWRHWCWSVTLSRSISLATTPC